MKHDDQQQVQQYIRQAGDHQIDHGALCIPHRPHGRRAEIVKHIGRHTEKINFDVDGCLVDNVMGRSHHFQQWTGHQESESPDPDAHEQRQRNPGMLRLPHAGYVPGAVTAGDDHARADAQPHEQIDQQVDQRTGGRHRCQRFMPVREIADHNDVRRVIQKLQDTCQNQGNGKPEDLRKERSFRHIDLISFSAFLSNPEHTVPP